MIPAAAERYASIAALALSSLGLMAGAQPKTRLDVCHAGSLTAAFAEIETAFAAQHPDVSVDDVSGGSVALAGHLAAGAQSCDVYAAADYLDIDLLLKPIGVASYTIVFAKGRMVLAYLATDSRTLGVAAVGEFKPPAAIPNAAPEWYKVLLAPGVRVSSSHPFLDPSGYRTHMIARLAEAYYRVPDLGNRLIEHITIAAMADTAARPVLGTDFSFQFTYEHGAADSAQRNPAYRYVVLPDRIDLSDSRLNADYARAVVNMPGLGPPTEMTTMAMPASRVAWGLTIPKASPHQEQAAAFVGLLLSEIGTAAFNAKGPTPIVPALISRSDSAYLPDSLRPFVTVGPIAP